MAIPVWLRAFPRQMTRPVPLASTLGLLLLGLFIWEYGRHPEWFGTYTPEEAVPNSNLDLSGLTPAEQAAVADIDNLTVLFNELGIESGGIPNIQAIAEDDGQNQPGANRNLLALAEPNTPRPEGGNTSPFAQYLEQYQFANRGLLGGGAMTGSGAIAEANPFAPTGGNATPTPAESFMNPLMFALQGQDPATRVNRDPNASALENEIPPSSFFDDTASQPPEGTDTATLTGEFSDQTVTIPGVSFPVLPTLPQMSPPPGTTGYTPPASLNLLPPISGSTAPSGFPATGLPSAGGVATPTGATGVAPLTAPQVDVSNGYVTPYAPVVPPTPAPTVNPSPFGVPRPPGSNIGGGYINTFSNPSSPRN